MRRFLRDRLAPAASLIALLGAAQPGAAAPSTAPAVIRSTKNSRSAPLRAFRPNGPAAVSGPREVHNESPLGKGPRAPSAGDPVVQRTAGPRVLEELGQFEGGAASDDEAVLGGRVVPPDTNGDIGPNHYFQFLNVFFTIYDRSGNIVLGPLPGNALWAGLGTACETSNDGDPIVQYDQLADRWMASQFAFPNFPDGPFHQCVAVSTTGDPTGTWNQYDFVYDDTLLNDYPKFGVWPDAYYMTVNEFQSPDFSGVGAGVVAFDRAAMLAGLPATAIRFQIPQEGGLLPADLDGLTPPPPGSPNFVMTFDTDPPRLSEWRFHADFANPAASTLTGPIAIPIAPFDVPVCGNSREACIPQPGTSDLLEDLGGRLMYRLAYRNFGDHESLVTNFTVNAAAPGSQAAVRWCEVRDPNGAPALFQEGTYAPDGTHRFMGSIAMDTLGDIALGYSESDAATYPSLAVAGRLVGDPPGMLAAEDVFLPGSGSQIGSANRWGDYSAMSVDPADDCTFWFTGEYYLQTGSFDWHTRVGYFKFPGCTTGPTGLVEGHVTDGVHPLSGATVTAGASSTVTDEHGHYQLRLPTGAYDMTAAAFGHVGAAVAGVPVTDGGDTAQDFVLAFAGSRFVDGVVRDASGGGWPLYARLEFSAPGFGGATVFTDPATGYYGLTLTAGATYQVTVSALVPGYGAAAEALAVPSGASSLVRNFGLAADLAGCSAPGYAGSATADFGSGTLPPGWSLKTSGQPWTVAAQGFDACGQPLENLTGGTGPFAIDTSDCEHGVVDSQLRTPVLNLAGAASARIQWKNDYYDRESIADVDVSTDGGTSWTNVWRRAGTDERGPGLQSVDISALAAGRPAVQARFRYQAFYAYWWQVDDVVFGEPGAACHALPGGLVVGHVHDANTGLALNGAAVVALPDAAETKSIATPDDPGEDDGLYVLFAASGAQTLEASQKRYGPRDQSVVVIPNTAVRLDFSLDAGRLAASPLALDARVPPGGATAQVLSLSNAGGRDAAFRVDELDVPLATAPAAPAGFAPERLRQSALARLRAPAAPARRLGAASAAGLPALPAGPKGAATLPAGRVLAQYPTGIAWAWGLAYDTDAGDYWLSNIRIANGDDRDYRYAADGTPTGDAIDEHPAVTVFAADGAYVPRTGTFWRVDVVDVGSSCIFELDPASRALTGRRICPETGTSERGLAYDPVTDTFYIGSWDDGALKHFDASGAILDSAYVGVPISGLAFNPTTGHVFALLNQPDHGHNVLVYDARNGYAPVGGFPITDDSGAPILPEGGGAGLDADCDGNLWVVDQASQRVYKAVSGERGFCPVDIPWLSVSPASGTVAAGASGSVGIAYDAAGLFPGLHRAQLQVRTDTPYDLSPIGASLTVEFLDVARDVPPGADPFESFIYAVAGADVMPGCDRNGALFCPEAAVIRADMAAYVWRAVHGPSAPPPVYTGIFADVNPFDRNADYIQGMYDDGITAGCQAPGQPLRFCPTQSISRAQMAVFIEKAVRGSGFLPPPCEGLFADVPCPPDPGAPFADWVELLYHDGITAGCASGGAPLFCPARPITNAQMSAFLVRAFGIPRLP